MLLKYNVFNATIHFMGRTSVIGQFFREKGVYLILHLIVLALSLLLVICISVDSFHNVAFYNQPKFVHMQVWICVAFMADFFIEFFLSDKKWHYVKNRFIFFLVAIPYEAILVQFNFFDSLPPELLYVIRYMPLIRGGYALAIVVGWLTYSKAAGLFFTYIIILLSTVYFASLTFFQFEHGPNPMVHTYSDAIWWASMNMTTVGCNIVAVTTVGKILSVVLACLGMMMFPIFTVYITNIITRHNQQGESAENMILIPKDIVDKSHEDHSDSDSAEDSASAD